MKQKYVLGFLFNDYDEVVLIRKNKPEWQKGLLNGVGGKIEFGEDPKDAMIREFKEETGVDVTEWFLFAVMSGPAWEVHCFTATGSTMDVETKEEERVIVVPFCRYGIPGDVVPNLHWLLPLAFDHDQTFTEIKYSK